MARFRSRLLNLVGYRKAIRLEQLYIALPLLLSLRVHVHS